MLAKTALAGIWVYQNYFSKRKGFRCAYSVVHGGTGCSGYAKFAIRDHGFWQAIPKIRRRFADCKDAHLEMQASCPVHAEPAPEERDTIDSRQRKKRRADRTGFCSEMACFSLSGCCAGSAASQSKNTGDGASSSCDIGAQDFSACSCGAPDCSGCDGCSCDGCSCN